MEPIRIRLEIVIDGPGDVTITPAPDPPGETDADRCEDTPERTDEDTSDANDTDSGQAVTAEMWDPDDRVELTEPDTNKTEQADGDDDGPFSLERAIDTAADDTAAAADTAERRTPSGMMRQDVRQRYADELERITDVELRAAVVDWFAYKADPESKVKRHQYSKTGARAFVSRAIRLADEQSAAAVANAMERAAAEGWEGWEHEGWEKLAGKPRPSRVVTSEQEYAAALADDQETRHTRRRRSDVGQGT